MAANATTFKVLHDWSKGHALGASEVISGYVAQLPSPLWATDSFELQIDFYEKYSQTSPVYSDFGAAATATLKIALADTGSASPVTLDAAGTVTTGGSTEYNRVTFLVPKDTLTSAFVGPNLCIIYAEISWSITGPIDFQRTCYQKLYVTDEDGDGSNTPTAAEMVYTPASSVDWPGTAPDDVASALDTLADGYQSPKVSASIDYKTEASTVVFTVPTGRYFIPRRGYSTCDVMTGYAAAHTGKWKTGAGDLTVALASAHTAVNMADVVDFDPTVVYPAGTIFSYEVTAAGTSTTHAGHAILEGVLYDA